VSMCWQRGHFKSAVVRYLKYGSLFREGASAIRIVAAVRAVDVEKPFPVFNGFDHGLRLCARATIGHAIAPPRAAIAPLSDDAFEPHGTGMAEHRVAISAFHVVGKLDAMASAA
jgi:hypothetical protein